VGDLRRLKPDVVIAVEVGARTMQAAMLRAPRRFVPSHRAGSRIGKTARSRGAIRRSVRRFLLPLADEVFVNGRSGMKTCARVRRERGTRLRRTQRHRHPRIRKKSRRPGGGAELSLLYVGQLIPRKESWPSRERWRTLPRRRAGRSAGASRAAAPLEAELRALTLPANLRLDFLGSKSYQELPRYYEDSDVFVMPSLSDEWGLVVNEAMASGLPVLAAPVRNPWKSL